MIVSASASSIVLEPEGRTPDLSQQKLGNSQNDFFFFLGGGGERTYYIIQSVTTGSL